MYRILRIVHFIALAVFLGSIFGHILLGQMAAAAALPLLEVKLAMIYALTLPGLGALAVSGAALALATRGRAGSRRWLAAKLALVVAVGLNGALVLTPIAAEQVAFARSGIVTHAAAFEALALRESIAGGVNLLAIALIVALAVYRPALRGARGAVVAQR